MSYVKYFLLLFTSLLLACTNNTSVAGGEDFPNSNISAALGSQIAEDIDNNNQWNSYDSILDTIPQRNSFAPYVDAIIITGKDLNSQFGTPRKNIVTLWDDSSKGTITRYTEKNYPLFGITIFDTLTIAYNNIARDSILTNDQVIRVNGLKVNSITGVRTYYTSFDSDMDGSFDSCWYKIERVNLAGRTIVNSLCFTDGQDRDISALNDNRIIWWKELAIEAADTLRVSKVEDADSDGVLFCFSQADSVSIRYSTLKFRPITGVVRSNQVTQLFYFIDTPEKSYPVKYLSETHFESGQTRQIVILSTKSTDSTFSLNDTVNVIQRRIHANGRRDTLSFHVVLSGTPLNYSGNKLQKFTIAHLKPDSSITKALFECTPNAPINSISKLSSGSFGFTGLTGTGLKFSVEGNFDETKIKGTYTDNSGTTTIYIWKRNGI